jgi:hypothetical protein
MRALATMLFLTVAVQARAADIRHPEAPAAGKLTSFTEAVATCRDDVRHGRYDDTPHESWATSFDAYVASDGTVQMYGHPEEQFQFDKCMDRHGHPLANLK